MQLGSYLTDIFGVYHRSIALKAAFAAHTVEYPCGCINVGKLGTAVQRTIAAAQERRRHYGQGAVFAALQGKLTAKVSAACNYKFLYV